MLSVFFGIGGGVVYTAYFAWLYPELTTEEVIINSICCIAVNSGASSLKLLYGRNKIESKYNVLISVVTVSVMLSYWMGVRSLSYPKEIFNMVILLLMLVMVLKYILESRKGVRGEKDLKIQNQGVVGLFGGVVAAFSGFGGGVLMVPLMTSIYKVDFKVAKNNSLLAIATMSSILVLSILAGNSLSYSNLSIQWRAVIPVSIVSAVVSFALLPLVEKVNIKKIRWMYLLFMMFFIGSKLFQLFF